jgi:hypothetical protein
MKGKLKGREKIPAYLFMELILGVLRW